METAISFITDADAALSREIRSLYMMQGWWEDSDEPAMVARIVRGSHCFAIARIGGRLAGMGRAISDRVSDAYIQDVVVKPEFRGQNLGSSIITAIVNRLKKDRLGWIALVAEGGSHPFYERLGFAPMKGGLAMRYAGEVKKS